MHIGEIACGTTLFIIMARLSRVLPFLTYLCTFSSILFHLRRFSLSVHRISNRCQADDQRVCCAAALREVHRTLGALVRGTSRSSRSFVDSPRNDGETSP